MSILISLLLSACSGMEQQEIVASEEGRVKYIAQYNNLSNIVEPYDTRMYLTTEHFYYVRETEGLEGLICRTLQQPEEQLITLFTWEEHQNMECFTVTPKEEVLLVVTDYTLSEDGRVNYSAVSERRMHKYSDDGKLLWEQSLPQELGDVLEILADSQGRIYLRTHDEVIHIYDAKGVKQNQVSASQVYHMASTPGGECYLLNNTQVRELSVDTGQMVNIPALERKNVYHTGQALGIIDDTALYTYQPKQDTALCKQIDLLEYYVDVSCVDRIAMDGDGNIAVLCRESMESRDVELILLCPQDITSAGTEDVSQTTEMSASEVASQSKITLQLAALNSESYARTIIDFNRSSATATVKMMQLPGEEELPMRIAASLLSENAPDMIQIKGGPMSDDYHKYADNGYLLDLTPYLESSEVLNKEAFADWVIEDFTVDGKLFALPTTMYFMTLLGPTEHMEGATNWNIEEFLDFIEKYPMAMQGECTEKNFPRIKELYLETILTCGIEAFVDREKGKAYLDGERFRNVLMRLNELDLVEVTEPFEERVDAGEVLVTEYKTIKSNRDFADAEWMQCHGGELTLIGFPTAEATPGEPGANMIYYDTILGITSTCEHPEEAWKFIERILMAAINGEVECFPTGKAALERKLQEETVVDYYMTKVEEDSWRKVFGYSRSVGVITQEQADKVRSGLEDSFWYARDVDNSLLIILEETKPYFAGQKSLDETVEILQSRMQIYLDERY